MGQEAALRLDSSGRPRAHILKTGLLTLSTGAVDYLVIENSAGLSLSPGPRVCERDFYHLCFVS